MGAEGGDLDDFLAKLNVSQPEAAADQPAVAEQLVNLFRAGVGGDVEVLRFAAEQQIPHPAADQTGAIAGLAQPVQDFNRVGADVGPRNVCSGRGMTTGGDSSVWIPRRVRQLLCAAEAWV